MKAKLIVGQKIFATLKNKSLPWKIYGVIHEIKKRKNYRKSYYVWNPSLRECMRLKSEEFNIFPIHNSKKSESLCNYKNFGDIKLPFLIHCIQQLIPIQPLLPTLPTLPTSPVQIIKCSRYPQKQLSLCYSFGKLPQVVFIRLEGFHIACYATVVQHYDEQRDHLMFELIFGNESAPLLHKELTFHMNNLSLLLAGGGFRFKDVCHIFMNKFGFLVLHSDHCFGDSFKIFKQLILNQTTVSIEFKDDSSNAGFIPPDFRIGDIVENNFRQSGIIQSFDFPRCTILELESFFTMTYHLHLLKFNSSPYCSNCKDQSAKCGNCTQIAKSVSKNFVSYSLCGKIFNLNPNWKPPRLLANSDFDCSLDCYKQINHSSTIRRLLQRVIFILIEGTDYPNRSSKGKILCSLTIVKYPPHEWQCKRPICSSSLSRKMWLSLDAITHQFHTLTLDQFFYVMIQDYGFVALSIENCKDRSEYDVLYEKLSNAIKNDTKVSSSFIE